MQNNTTNQATIYQQLLVQNLDKIPEHLHTDAIKFIIAILKEDTISYIREVAQTNMRLINKWQNNADVKLYVNFNPNINTFEFNIENDSQIFSLHYLQTLQDFITKTGVEREKNPIIKSVGGLITEYNSFYIDLKEFIKTYNNFKNEIYANEFKIEFNASVYEILGDKNYATYIEAARQEGLKFFANVSVDTLNNKSADISVMELALRNFPKNYHMDLIKFAESFMNDTIQADIKNRYEENLTLLNAWLLDKGAKNATYVNIENNIHIYTDNHDSKWIFLNADADIAAFIKKIGTPLETYKAEYSKDAQVASNTFKVDLDELIKFLKENKEKIINNQVKSQIAERQQRLFGDGDNNQSEKKNKLTP